MGLLAARAAVREWWVAGMQRRHAGAAAAPAQPPPTVCAEALSPDRAPACLPASYSAARVVLVAPDEWAQGSVRVKDMASREEADVPVDQLV